MIPVKKVTERISRQGTHSKDDMRKFSTLLPYLDQRGEARALLLKMSDIGSRGKKQDAPDTYSDVLFHLIPQQFTSF